MRLYPTVRSRRAATVAGDVLVVVLVALFAWCGIGVHDAVSSLGEVADELSSSGAGAQEALEEAAQRVTEVPLVGSVLAQALRDAGREAGGEAVSLGRAGREQIDDTADLLGWGVFLIPTVLLLIGFLPNRYAQVQRLTAAHRILGDGETAAAHPRLVAMRALYGLPYPTLLRYTRDPFGDMERGNYDPLLEAAYEEAGLER